MQSTRDRALSEMFLMARWIYEHPDTKVLDPFLKRIIVTDEASSATVEISFGSQNGSVVSCGPEFELPEPVFVSSTVLVRTSSLEWISDLLALFDESGILAEAVDRSDGLYIIQFPDNQGF